MDSDPFSVLNLVCAGFFMICTVVFFYYLYLSIKTYMRCKSEMKEELPCPNTCNPGYECKQSEAAADFVIGEVVEEGVAEDEKQQEADEAVAQAAPEAVAVAAPEAVAVAASI